MAVITTYLIPPAIWNTNRFTRVNICKLLKNPMEALGAVDFTNCAVSNHYFLRAVVLSNISTKCWKDPMKVLRGVDVTSTVDPLYNDTLYNSKILYNISWSCTKVSNHLEFTFITTAIWFNVTLLGNEHHRCKEVWLYELSIVFY